MPRRKRPVLPSSAPMMSFAVTFTVPDIYS